MKPRSIVEAVYLHAEDQPDSLCLADAGHAYTYRQVWACILHAKNTLYAAGASSGDCVLVECTQNAAYSICILAVQLLGAISVPLERGTNAERIRQIANETDARFFIGRSGGEQATDSLRYLSTEQVIIADIGEPCCSKICFPNGTDTAELLFTTGTTGKSKGIEITHENNIAVAENVIFGVEMKTGGVEMIFAPLSHSHGLRRQYANLLFGNAVVLCEGIVFVQNVFTLMTRYNVSALDIVPAALKVLLKVAGDRIGAYGEQIDYVQIGTAPLQEPEMVALREMLPNTRLYNFYGSTEAGCSCILDFNRERNRVGSIGKPTCNSCVFAVDENRKPIRSSPSSPGYLACSGGMVMKGYWRQPELTNTVLVGGILYTNDVIFQDDDGYIYLVGRKDNVINCGGIKISPEEIERVAVQFAGVEECALLGKPDPISGQVPVMFIVMKEGEAFSTSALSRYLVQTLDSNKLPKEIRILPALPKTFNGKLLRSALQQLIDNEADCKTL